MNYSFVALLILLRDLKTDSKNNIINFKNFQFKWDKLLFLYENKDFILIINPFLPALPATIILLTISIIIINLLKSRIFPQRYPKVSKKQLFFNSLFTGCFLWLILFTWTLFWLFVSFVSNKFKKN